MEKRRQTVLPGLRSSLYVLRQYVARDRPSRPSYTGTETNCQPSDHRERREGLTVSFPRQYRPSDRSMSFAVTGGKHLQTATFPHSCSKNNTVVPGAEVEFVRPEDTAKDSTESRPRVEEGQHANFAEARDVGKVCCDPSERGNNESVVFGGEHVVFHDFEFLRVCRGDVDNSSRRRRDFNHVKMVGYLQDSPSTDEQVAREMNTKRTWQHCGQMKWRHQACQHQ